MRLKECPQGSGCHSKAAIHCGAQNSGEGRALNMRGTRKKKKTTEDFGLKA